MLARWAMPGQLNPPPVVDYFTLHHGQYKGCLRSSRSSISCLASEIRSRARGSCSSISSRSNRFNTLLFPPRTRRSTASASRQRCASSVASIVSIMAGTMAGRFQSGSQARPAGLLVIAFRSVRYQSQFIPQVMPSRVHVRSRCRSLTDVGPTPDIHRLRLGQASSARPVSFVQKLGSR